MTTAERPPAPSSFRRQMQLLAYARPQWRGLLVVLASMLANVAFELLKPWPLKLVIDNVLGNQATPGALTVLPGAEEPRGLLVWITVGTVLIFLLYTATHMIYTYSSLQLGQRMTFRLAGDLFSHLQRMSLMFHRRRTVGDMLARVTGDSYCVSTLVSDAYVPALQAVVTLVSMFVVMFSLQPTLTVLALGIAPFFVVVIKRLGPAIKERTREQRDLEGSMMAVVEQTLSAMPAVQAYTREEVETRRFRGYADRTIVAYVRATLAGLWFELFAGLVTTVGTAAVIYVGAELALRGELTAGTIIVFISYLSSLYEPLDSVTHTAQTVQGASAEADRVMEILETEPELHDKPGARPAHARQSIRYEHVTYGYRRGTPVLRDVSLEARPGEVIAVVGPTGAGKTTLMNLLVRFDDPWEGRVLMDGRDLRDLRLRSVRQQVALVLQDPFLFPISVSENIRYGRPGASDEDVVAAARAANADEFIRAMPEGYGTVIGEKGATLSGGEKQRISIARAFLKDAPVLVLDEPTSALDARTEAMLLDAMERLMAGRITFIIAHRLSTIRQATTILSIQHGRIVERGTHQELLEAGGLYAELHRQQMEAREDGDQAKGIVGAGERDV
jgi:ATP-binding cassette subfamily B protein/subfamily B ATP-binding cassette protein MsbA